MRRSLVPIAVAACLVGGGTAVTAHAGRPRTADFTGPSWMRGTYKARGARRIVLTNHDDFLVLEMRSEWFSVEFDSLRGRFAGSKVQAPESAEDLLASANWLLSLDAAPAHPIEVTSATMNGRASYIRAGRAGGKDRATLVVYMRYSGTTETGGGGVAASGRLRLRFRGTQTSLP